MSLAWYFEGESRKTPEGSESRPSLPSEPDYANDVSQIFISLAEEDGPGGARGAGAKRGASRSRRRETDEEDMDSTQSSGALAEYFSSLFDESFCSHSFKLVGSRIFSSGKFQEEEANNARDTELSLGKAASSNESINGSSASSASSSGMSNGDSDDKMSEGEPWGWFDEIEDAGGGGGAAGPTTTKATPPYILTESLSSQRLWRETAGQRPRQPSLERQFFEEQWAKNFSGSEVDYTAPLRATESAAASKRARKRKASKVLYRATSPFGSAVSKSFQCDYCGQITSIMVHIPKFQIVQTGSDVHAEYLIVVGLGTVTLGVWRRFSEFKRLARKLGRSSRRAQFHNALCSWRCLTERQRWFRCLDRDYLILKTFLLERFLHDLVFESVSPNTVRDLLGVL